MEPQESGESPGRQEPGGNFPAPRARRKTLLAVIVSTLLAWFAWLHAPTEFLANVLSIVQDIRSFREQGGPPTPEAPPCTIRGRLIEESAQQTPIIGAVVHVVGHPGLVANSEIGGSFQLDATRESQSVFELEILARGFRTRKQTTSCNPDFSTYLMKRISDEKRDDDRGGARSPR